jgi:hypothetical protein
MEVLITSLSLLSLLAIVILVATGGHPSRFFTAFGETMVSLSANRGPFFWTVRCVFLVLGF